MKTLKVLSALLAYPQSDIQAALPEMAEALEQEAMLPEAERAVLQALIQRLSRAELMALQEQYCLLYTSRCV